MTANVLNVWNMLHGMQIYPEVSAGILALYFFTRRYTAMSDRWSVCIALSMGQLFGFAYDLPTSLQDAMQGATMNLIMSFVAVGVYSMADKYGWPERVSGMFTRKMDKMGG